MVMTPCSVSCASVNISLLRSFPRLQRDQIPMKHNDLVAGQPEFESKDCHPQMKIRMITIILCDNYFVGMEHLNFTCTGCTEAENEHFVLYNYVTPSENHEISVGTFNL
jgi:hypothetical protein